jgi:hypothetical protein
LCTKGNTIMPSHNLHGAWRLMVPTFSLIVNARKHGYRDMSGGGIDVLRLCLWAASSLGWCWAILMKTFTS